MLVVRLTVRVHLAEKLSGPGPQAELGLPSPKFISRKLRPSSRIITGSPDRSVLLKYSPFHLFAGTFCRQLMAASILILGLLTPLRGSVTFIPEFIILSNISETLAVGNCCLSIAHAPDTCAAATDVPETSLNPPPGIGAEVK